nr:hypothetical protein [Sedimentibacter sp.]
MKQYIDATKHECVVIFATDDDKKQIEIVQAGITIYSMPIRYKKEYLTLEEKGGVFFIFDDYIPKIDFYAVPRIDIFARYNHDGYLGTVGDISDMENLEAPICYIDKNMNVFKVANCMREFLFPTETIRERMKFMEPISGINFFSSLEEAKGQYDFLNIE